MQPGYVIGGLFELRLPAGEGGMGRVFRAFDLERQVEVAVKVLRDEVDAERFLREGKLLARLAHANIVGYVSHGRADEGSLYLVMDWVEGETLAGRLARTGLDVVESVEVVRGMARGLAAAHRAGVLHRDLKPSNVLLAGGDPAAVRLIDFGIARRLDDVSLTRTGTALGTPGYMAPEQVRGLKQLDGRADTFALGCILYECLTGARAFSGSNVLAVQCKILAFEPPSLELVRPEAPAALIALCEAMLAKAPAERPREIAAVEAALEAIRVDARGGRRPVGSAGFAPTADGGTLDTAVGEPVVFAVLASPPRDDDDQPLPLPAAARATLTAQATAEGGDLELLADGTWMLVLEDRDGVAGAARAARLALALAHTMPGGEVVVSASRTSGLHTAIGNVVDAGACALNTSMVEGIFAVVTGTRPAGAVRLDALTASLLGAPFAVQRVRGVSWLCAVAAA